MLITFYSYKGGVGRSLALANLACLLAEDEDHPQSVLLWDFDLEAPGLRRLFPPTKPHKSGFVDLVHHFANAGEVLDVDDFIYESAVSGIDVLSAGHVDNEYCEKLQSIDWPRLFTTDRSDAGPFFSEVLSQIRRLDYDYVLIDSRTGLNDQAGICTQVLSDLVVIIFRLTDQNLDGIEHLVPSIRGELVRRDRGSVHLIPIASEVPSNSSSEVHDRRDRATAIFETKHLQYIRFDSDLVADETLFCLKSEQVKRWPVPTIVDDYAKLCDHLRERNPNDTRTALQALQKRMRADDPTSASALLKKLLERRPRVAQLWDDLGALTARMPKQQSAEFDRMVELILSQDSQNSFAQEWKANRLIERAASLDDVKLAEARELLGRAIDNSDRPAHLRRLHRRMADVASCLGELDHAVEALRESMKHSPQNAKMTLDLANLYVRKGSAYFGSAIDVLKTFPQGAAEEDRLVLLTLLYSFTGNDELAQHSLERMTDDPDSGNRVRLFDAHRHLAAGKIDEAIKIVESTHWTFEDEWSNVSEFYICAEQFDRAVVVAQNASDQGDQSVGLQSVALQSLANYLNGGSDTSEAKVIEDLKEWDLSWRFCELLFFRERVRRKDKNRYGDRLNIIESLIRQQSLKSIANKYRHSIGGVRRGRVRFVYKDSEVVDWQKS